MNYKKLLAEAPPHDSDEFLDYLRENNKVILQLRNWLIIENCKYNREDRRWWTAFQKRKTEERDFNDLHFCVPDGWNVMVKPQHKQTVQRFHVHIYQDKK